MASSILCQNDERVALFFVIPSNLEVDDCDNDMKDVFQSSVDKDLEPSWKTEESCLLLSPSKQTVFVFQKFEGPAFDHLEQFNCVILGPRCLGYCLMLDEHIPVVDNPIFTAPMKDLVITSSGGGVEVKNEIQKKVKLMGGKYSKNLLGITNYVVVSSVGSSKYEKALELGIPVRTHEWVDAVWKKSLKEYISAKDDIFDHFKCPPFLDLKVCSSGLGVKEREHLKNTVVKYKGTFELSLSRKTNILVVKGAKGEKFKYAMTWGIPCVEPRWIYDSVESEHALPVDSYKVHGGRAASSPTSVDASLIFPDDVSTIQFDQRTHINETVMNSTTSSVASFCPAFKATTPVKMPPPAPKRTPVKTPVKTNIQPGPTPGELKHLLNELDLNKTKKAGSFLDGCGVYLSGWNGEEEEILRKILKCSGAARFTDLNESVSHVLVGNLEKPFVRTLKNLSHKPHVVNIKWLIASVAEKCPSFEEPFYCLPNENLNASEAPSPLSKKGMALLQRETFSPKKPLVVKQLSTKEEGMSPNKGKRQLLAKYKSSDLLDPLDKSDGPSLSTSALCMPPPPVPTTKISHQSNDSWKADESDVSSSQDMIFAGLNFVIVGLSDTAASYVEQDLILKYGGSVVSKSFKGVPDYAVVPLTGATLQRTATEIITILWLESCIEEQSILPVSYYHQPVVLNVDKKPLEGCVLGLSGFSEKERQFVSELASALGAVCQEVFAKRSKGNAKASSHLICKSTEKSEKLNAAIKWCRPAVFHSWLLACAASGSRVLETEHMVDPKQDLSSSDCANSTTTSVTVSSRLRGVVEPPQIAALKKHPWPKTPERTPVSYDKDEVARILNWVPSPNRWEVKTPPVPLGLSDNPTPGESKRIQKWLDRLPGQLPPSPPPPRRDSTPLHVLRKRVLQAHSVTTPEMLHLVPLKDGGIYNDDDNIPESAVAMKDQDENVGLNSSNSTSLPPDAACSTPTLNTKSHTSRNLFESNGRSLGTPIDGHLDKLNKLMATPEVNEGSSSVTSKTKTAHVDFIKHENKKNQVMYDTLKDGSQPYAIKWEDPVNVRRMPLDGYVSPNKPNNGELPSKRKSSETAVTEEPPAKRKSSENTENTPKAKKSHSEIVLADPQIETPKMTYKFSISHVEDREIVTLIHKLGGKWLDSTAYNPEATHLICGKPQRSEKLLAFIASGKWVLHPSFIHESAKQGKFVKEDDYEWGNPKRKFEFKPEPKSFEDVLSKAAYRWKTTLAKTRSAGAFDGFTVKILTPSEKAVAFTRLINAGGGHVLPENSPSKPSFCLVNVSSHMGSIAEYVKLGIPCLRITFLYDYLTGDPPPKPEDNVLPEYKKLREAYECQRN